MQTAAISYRVVDFLKQHPPFHGMEDADLLELVSRGRVRFNETESFMCWQGTSYGPFLFVIQQGVVLLWETINDKEVLRDIRGPGDMIGIERFLGSKSYPYAAKTDSDVVVYALPAADFEPLLAKYPHTARFVNAHGAPGAVYLETTRQGAHEKFVVELARHPEPLSCPPECTVAEAARILRTARAEAIAVMQDQRMLGVLTSRDIIASVADGGSPFEAVQNVMSPPPPPVAPNTVISDCVLAMGRSNSSFAALTADGTLHGGLLRLISSLDLQPAFGDNPLLLLHDIAAASDIEVLRLLHARARAFLLSQLTGPSTVDWLAALSDRINTGIIQRLTELAGNSDPNWSWCFWGAAGRCELLTPVEPGLALLCHDDADVGRGLDAIERIRADLAACGYLPHTAPEWSDATPCATVAAWQERFAEWIRDPILNEMYTARPLFDLRPCTGSADSWRQLESSVREAILREPAFPKLLTHDCLSSLPPLTFFEESVVDDSGERNEIFALEHRALAPIADVGRVLGMAHGRVLGASTLERLQWVQARLPAHERIFRETTETLRVLLYLQARTGLRLYDSGAEMLPSQLSRFDRQALKSGFRAIHNLLAFTVEQMRVKTL